MVRCINLPVYETYADDCVTGTVPLEQRPAGRRLLQDARAKRFDQVLLFKLDRLGRDTRHTLNAVAELEQCGVRVRSMTEEFDTNTAAGRLVLTLLSGFAAHEREQSASDHWRVPIARRRRALGSGESLRNGFRKEGSKGEGRLVINADPIPDSRYQKPTSCARSSGCRMSRPMRNARQ
jgi:site-specific DNA recombinase